MGMKAIPDGYGSITAYLIVDAAADAIGWYEQAFGARELFRLPMGDKIGHAELQIGDSRIKIADEFPDMKLLGPKARGGTSVTFMFYTDDVDAAFAGAISAGAVEESPVADQFYGDRTGTLRDPYGHRWTIATHVEDVELDEMQRRLDAMG
jgi:PhnB protein